MWNVFLLTLLILSVAIAAIAIRMFVKKDGAFRKSCSSVDPKTGQPFGCTCGQADGDDRCENRAAP